FDEVGITQQFSAARTPQQNGVVERRNRTLVKAARTMLTFANLPSFLWAGAIATGCFTQNRSIIHKRFDRTPYELINKRKPNIKFFRVFGCRCYLLNDYDDVGKLKAKGDIGVFVDLNTFSSVRRPKHSSVVWKKKGSSNTSNVDLSAVFVLKLNKNVKQYSRKDFLACNNSHLGETSSAYVCNDTMNVSCNPRMCDLLDDNDFFIFDDVNVRISPVSMMPFKKKPRDFMHVRSKSNMIKSLPRTMHKWLPKMQPLAEPVAKWFPRIVQICLWIITSGCSKHMMGNRALLTNFVEKFLETVCFGNNDFAVIAGYGDVVIGSMTIKKVYYVEGLGHNLFSVGQFYDKGLEVAFRKSTCFVRNEDGVITHRDPFTNG
nr:retrovirus-related Pol polyprotein from transposon TNT 1-94 [Tanacetum cinerariifolium]